jgi:hypothetical protein
MDQGERRDDTAYGVMAFSLLQRGMMRTPERIFGAPARTYHFGQYVIMTWNKNLLNDIR